MKVNNKSSNPMASIESAKAGKIGTEAALESKKNKSVSAAQMNESARVGISQRAQDVKKAKELATPSDSIDEAKVARLQALIDKGEYKVNAEAIADKLVDEHLLMS